VILNGSVGDLCNIFEIIALESVMFAEVIDVKKRFLRFFIQGTFFTFLTFFILPTFLFLKKFIENTI